MSLRQGSHHKICRLLPTRPHGCTRGNSSRPLPSEGGYALVALLALMSLLALFATAAAPSIRQQSQREREKEAIFRGEQVADAIRAYYLNRLTAGGGPGDPSLPTSIDQLLEGVPVLGGSKKRQILRASAARDPLSTSGEWRTIRSRSQDLLEFQGSVMLYAGNSLPQPQQQQLQQLQQFAAPPLTNAVEAEPERSTQSEADLSGDAGGPFVGVSSRSRTNSVLYYYGIDRHDQWIFTPLFR
ncbi:MAG: hypothetical protein LC776_02525 [Acidobacteria bacterium]|nr:hypothetical protein [Acidobacteriota bacterium]